MSDFDVKLKLVIFGHERIFALRTGVKETNDDVREKEFSRSPGRGAGVFHLYPLSFSVLKVVRTSTPAPGLRVPVNVYALSNPISALFRVSACTI